MSIGNLESLVHPLTALFLIAVLVGTAIRLWLANRQIAAQLPEIGGEEQSNAASCGSKTAAKTDDKATKPPEPAPPKTPVTTNPPPKTVVAENTPPKPVVPPVKPPPPVEKPPVEKPAVAARNTPPEPLVQAFDNYLAGRYAEVVRVNPDSYADTRARFHAYLVRAASKYTLSRISADAEMLKAAEKQRVG